MEENSQPKLWNPNSAANWSLLFTPIFGAWLHVKNWDELGKPEEAKRSMIWVYAGALFLLSSLFLTLPVAASRAIGPIWLFSWYFTSAKAQIKHVGAMTSAGGTYVKKPWILPLSVALAGLIAIFTIFNPAQPSITQSLESESVSVVSQIIKEQSTMNTRCNKVKIVKELPDKNYQAVAYLENGNTLNISIKIKGDQFYVEIPAQ